MGVCGRLAESPFIERDADTLSLLAAALAVPALVAHPVNADTINSGGTVTVTPGGRITQTGFRTAVVSATATDGDAAIAQSALLAANVALTRVPGYIAIPSKEVAGAFGGIKLHDQLDSKDYQAIGKKLKAQRILSLTVSPLETTDTSSAYSALVEVYDAVSGGLVGRGQSTYTATAEALAADDSKDKTPANSGTAEQALPNRALGGAVYQAIRDLSRPATFNGSVISIPGAYTARLSLGERSGLRSGARIEYLENGVPVAYGTVVDLGVGESLATVAPEANVNLVKPNTFFRTVSNPTADRAGKTANEITNAEFKKFERDLGISAAIAGIIYYIAAD